MYVKSRGDVKKIVCDNVKRLRHAVLTFEGWRDVVENGYEKVDDEYFIFQRRRKVNTCTICSTLLWRE